MADENNQNPPPPPPPPTQPVTPPPPPRIVFNPRLIDTEQRGQKPFTVRGRRPMEKK